MGFLNRINDSRRCLRWRGVLYFTSHLNSLLLPPNSPPHSGLDAPTTRRRRRSRWFGSACFSPKNLSLVPTQQEFVRCVPIKAYFLCTSIDLKGMQSENKESVVPPTSRSPNHVAFRYCKSALKASVTRFKEDENISSHMIVFQYGSAVLFNVADHEAEDYLDMIRRHATGLLPEMRRDDYAVIEKPVLATWMQGGPDHIILKNLDMDGIQLIGSVLGQSIALDYITHQVDFMVEEFNEINRGMEKMGTFIMERKRLFQLVGRANSSLADVIIKLGLLDRSEIAWRNANCAQILEYLREEFELSQRFEVLAFKLKFVEHNIHFLLEVLVKRRSDLLDWFIIVLLFIENVLEVYDIVSEST